jgi:lysophospholipase L1-like esterase
MSFLKKHWVKLLIAFICLFLAVVLIIHFAVIFPAAKERRELDEAVRKYYAEKLLKYEQENATYGDYEVDVAFIGDSLTDGYDLEKYYPQYLTSNRGIGGETTYGLKERIQVSVYDLKPKVVVMLIGANNMDTMMQDYESLIVGLKENLPESEVVVLSLTAMGDEWGRKNQLAAYNNVSIELLAKKHGCYFVDLFSPLYDVEIGQVYDGYTVDGGHFTPKGYEVVTAQITPVLQEILGR